MVAVTDDVRWLTPEERDAWLATAALMVKLPVALDSQLTSDADLSFFEYMVLAVLSEQPDRTLQMSQIAEFASASLSRLSHTAARLEAKGFLTRTQVPGKGRRIQAALTEAGYAKVVATAPGHVARVRELLIDPLTPEQLTTLRDIGAQVLARIDPSPAAADDGPCS